MKYLFILFFSAVTLSVSAQGTFNPEKITRVWRSNQQIRFVYHPEDSNQFHPERENGNYRVFEYTYSSPEYSEVSDDEKTETISFQIPMTVKRNFRYRGSWVARANSYFLLGCFCPNRGFHKIREGEIRGRKINNTTWEIHMNLRIDAGQPDGNPIIKKISGRFVQAQD